MSAEFSIGIEEEYQLVDPASGELRSRAPEVLREDWGAELHPEMQQTMVEVGTPICSSAAEAQAEVARLRVQASVTASTRGLEIVAAGLHPDDAWERQRASGGVRYHRIAERLGRVGRTDHVFGLHIHVAVPAEVDRLRLIGVVRRYLPHLAALSASSPFYAGEDTGYASYRTVLAGRLPNAGMPPALDSEAEFGRLKGAALAAGVLPDEASLYWSLRPHHRYPTIEFRACDACPRLEDAAAIAALARAITAAGADGLLEERRDGLGPGATDALLRANQWQAARYGLQATIAGPAGAGEPIADGIHRLLERTARAGEALGDGAVLAGVPRILARGNGADRMRALVQGGTPLRDLVGWLGRETLLGAGIDRRAEQRTPVGPA